MNEKSRGEARTRKAQEKVLEYLRESGNIWYACKRAGVGRQTFYDWKENNGSFALEADRATMAGKEFVNDLAHTKLVQNINEGDFRAVKFQLTSRHPDYQPKRPRDPHLDDVINNPLTQINIVPVTPEMFEDPERRGQLGVRLYKDELERMRQERKVAEEQERNVALQDLEEQQKNQDK